MPVTEMPGQSRQMGQVTATNLDQRLGRDHNIDDAAIFEFERVPIAQQDRFRKHDRDRCPVHAGQLGGLHAASVTGNNHAVDWHAVALIRGEDTNNAPHG